MPAPRSGGDERGGSAVPVGRALDSGLHAWVEKRPSRLRTIRV
jgi:hypothetical protein